MSICDARIGRFSLEVVAPNGDLPPGRQLVITSARGRSPERGLVQLLAVGIGLFDNGAKFRGALSSPLGVTLRGAGLNSATTVYEVTPGGSFQVAAASGPGSLEFSVTSDPLYSIDDPVAWHAPHH